MGNLKCSKCSYQPDNESDLDEHHIVPKFWGGTDKDGRVYLCSPGIGNDCHRNLHKRIAMWIKAATERWLDESFH